MSRVETVTKTVSKMSQKLETDINHNDRPQRYHQPKDEVEPIPGAMYYSVILGYVILYLFGILRDFIRMFRRQQVRSNIEEHREEYPKLYNSFDVFFIRNVYRPASDCFLNPILSVPGGSVTIRDIYSEDYNCTFKYKDTQTTYTNFGSYNYLGFAENYGDCANDVEDTLYKDGYSLTSTRHEIGTHKLHQELENTMADFLGVESAIVFGMGFATNSTNIPTLVGQGCLVISDELNHASLCLGCKLSGAITRTFSHNDMSSLEKVLQNAVYNGQPKTGGPWKKILIIVEGIHSMEGTIVHLPEVIELKKKYKASLYLDEAHSIGSLGPNGRGVVDYYGVDPTDIDILMGTFTKSFGSAGGYVAGKRSLINYIRATSPGFAYGTSMAPPVVKQIIASCRQIMSTKQGDERIKTLARNTRYFRRRLKDQGFIIKGNDDSPVVPLMLYLPSKLAACVRALKDEKVATVGVGYPATPLTETRLRFCISSAHTKEMLDRCLDCIDKIGDKLYLKHSRRPRNLQGKIEY